MNKEHENVEVCENKLEYFPIDETRANIITVKQNVVKMLMDERKRNTVNQQSYLLPKFIDDPELHVGTSFKHKCKEEGSNEVIWCSGKVLSIHALKDKTAEFCVRYCMFVTSLLAFE